MIILAIGGLDLNLIFKPQENNLAMNYLISKISDKSRLLKTRPSGFLKCLQRDV